MSIREKEYDECEKFLESLPHEYQQKMEGLWKYLDGTSDNLVAIVKAFRFGVEFEEKNERDRTFMTSDFGEHIP